MQVYLHFRYLITVLQHFLFQSRKEISIWFSSSKRHGDSGAMPSSTLLAPPSLPIAKLLGGFILYLHPLTKWANFLCPRNSERSPSSTFLRENKVNQYIGEPVDDELLVWIQSYPCLKKTWRPCGAHDFGLSSTFFSSMGKCTFVNSNSGLEKINVEVLLCEAKFHLQFCQGRGVCVRVT